MAGHSRPVLAAGQGAGKPEVLANENFTRTPWACRARFTQPANFDTWVPLVAESDPDSHLKLLGSFVVDLDLTACECGLGALKNASVVTVPGKPQIVNNGGPADVQSLVAASAS